MVCGVSVDTERGKELVCEEGLLYKGDTGYTYKRLSQHKPTSFLKPVSYVEKPVSYLRKPVSYLRESAD